MKNLVGNLAEYQPIFWNNLWRMETADPDWLGMTQGRFRLGARARRAGAEDQCAVDRGAAPRRRLRTMEAAERTVRRSASYPEIKEVQALLGFALESNV